jgi:hypothetical protein
MIIGVSNRPMDEWTKEKENAAGKSLRECSKKFYCPP